MSQQNESPDVPGAPGVLPVAWVDRIFEKLALTYGRDFLGRWEGMDLAAVKADWREELSGGYLLRNPEAIRYALENLPLGKPPTVIDFRALCFKRPDTSMPALPAPDPAGLKRIASSLASGLKQQDVPLTTRSRECLDRLRERVRRNSASPGQRDFLRLAEAGLGLVNQGPIAASEQIDAKTLPPGMRQPARPVAINSAEWFVSAPAVSSEALA